MKMRAITALCCVVALVAFVVSQAPPGPGPAPEPDPNAPNPAGPDPAPDPAGPAGPDPAPGPGPDPNYPQPGPEPGPVVPEDRFECDSASRQCVASSDESGIPLDDCQQTCGKSTNSTPSELIGSFRGIRVDNMYQVGEWRAVIDKRLATIYNPMGQVWAQGPLTASNENLGIFTKGGFLQGIRSWVATEQVGMFTWALGGPKMPGPSDFDTAMAGKKNNSVFVFARCLDSSPNCDFSTIRNVLSEIESDASKKPPKKPKKPKKPVPGVPAAVKGKVYRGLQISKRGCAGEFRFSFGTSTVNVTAPRACGQSSIYKVSTVGDYRMWWTKPNSPALKVLWQLDGGVVTEFLNLASGTPGSSGPKDFNAGMLTNEFILAGCQEPYPNTPQTCFFL